MIIMAKNRLDGGKRRLKAFERSQGTVLQALQTPQNFYRGQA